MAVDRMIAYTWVGSIVLAAVALGFIATSFALRGPASANESQWASEPTIFIIQEIGSGLLLLAITALVGRVVFDKFKMSVTDLVKEYSQHETRELMQTVHSENRDLLHGITGKTDEVFAELRAEVRRISTSDAAMQRVGLVRIYANRREAAGDMAHDLQDPEIETIRILGISLKDLRDPGPDQLQLGKAWADIQGWITGEPSSLASARGGRHCTIRVLIIDPNCLGATYRSFAESRADRTRNDNLGRDVRAAVDQLTYLMDQSERNASQDVTLEFKLYRLPPSLFLCSTDSVSYVQPYYFWSSTAPDVAIPVLKLQAPAPQFRARHLHQGMKDHFDWIWQHASITPDDLRNHATGFDKPLYQSGVDNVYTDLETLRRRIHYLLRAAKRRVWVQGISLRAYLHSDGEFYRAVREVSRRPDINLRLLLLEPESEQARYRAYREHTLPSVGQGSRMTLSEFSSDEAKAVYRSTRLYRDTHESIESIRQLKHRYGANIDARLYATAPAFFLLMCDDRLLVEQYHYGSLVDVNEHPDGPDILGKDVPILEFADGPPQLADEGATMRPFASMESHFEFVFSTCSAQIDTDG